ncbi:MAG TPA: isoprenylcysteine carboxylmethyltransferase family protein [Hyphomicrobiaceae bacterium]|jgi:methyltransferase|nr:isoprenylcysteine carboxylmethyltransferase family protein [Hyphomicrobiaceae bacterium]
MNYDGLHLDAAAVTVLALVTAQRLGELVYARFNERRLKNAGAVEHGASHYPLIVALHAAWLAGLWFLASGIRPDYGWLSIFVLLQAARIWVLHTLGPRWTTRIIVPPDKSPIRTGPYRFLSHPNYAVVAAEIFVLPMAFGLFFYALLFSALNALVLAIRIRAEDTALRGSGVPSHS